MVDVPGVSLSLVPAGASVEVLRGLLAERDLVIAGLVERVVVLEARLGKNSRNSSKPPSSDGLAKPAPKSLRRPSGATPGKQPGAPGAALRQTQNPDEVVVHDPVVCAGCGAPLAGADQVRVQVRQVFDLPAVRLQVAEHRVVQRRCGCGTLTAGVFPPEATAPACYGPGVAALGAYLMFAQHLPVDRAARCMSDALGAPVSTGYLACLAGRAAVGLEGFLADARARLGVAAVAHFDETGARAAGKLRWVHVATSDTTTVYHLHDKRGREGIDAGGVLPGFAGVAVHDGLAAYRGYPAAGHGLCNAHHLRELAGIGELTGQDWPGQLAGLLVEILRAVDDAKTAGKAALPARVLAGYLGRYDRLIAEGKALNPPPPRTGKRGRPALGPAGSLLARLHTHRDDVLRFATDFDVPFDNNAAERAIRMIKLQQKISGGWRTTDGAEHFLAARSYLATTAKHHINPLTALRDLFNGHPWTPALNP